MSSYIMNEKAIDLVTKLSASNFWITFSQFQSFALSDLIGATNFSQTIAETPMLVVTFLRVVLERVYLLQKRLNLIQQHSLDSILQKRLRDINYHFAVDVRDKQTKNPDRKQDIVQQAINERLIPRGVEWIFSDGKWKIEEER